MDVASALNTAFREVKKFQFTEKGANKLRLRLKSSNGPPQGSRALAKDLCERLRDLFKAQDCVPSLAGLRFFYTVLVLCCETEGVSFCETRAEGEVRVDTYIEDTNTLLWTRVFKGGTHEHIILDFLDEFTCMVKDVYPYAPCVCYIICQHLRQAYSSLSLSTDLDKQFRGPLGLMMAKCAALKGKYDIAEAKAKEAAERDYDCHNVEAFDVWSDMCSLQHKTKLARKINKRAKKCDLIHSQPPRMFGSSERRASENGDARMVTSMSRKGKKKHQKKYKTLTQEFLMEIEKLLDEEMSSPEEDETDEESDSNLIDSDTDEEEKEKYPKQGDEENWYEISQDRLKNGHEDNEIMANSTLDVEYKPGAKEITTTLKYTDVDDKDYLENLLKEHPDLYKRCQIKLEEPHYAVCRRLDEGHIHEEIEIFGRQKCGQAFNGDEVVVEILEKDYNHKNWVKQEDKEVGKVVGILSSDFKKKEFPILACTVSPTEPHVMFPLSKITPRITIWRHYSRTRHQEKKFRIDVYKAGENGRLSFADYFDISPMQIGQYVFLVVYLNWDPHFWYPMGAVVKVLDCGKYFNGGMNILRSQFGVTSFYGEEAIKSTKSASSSKTSVKGRADLREMLVFTIDGAEAKDLDDALSVCKYGDKLKVGVHIADVTCVVMKGDALDREAESKATSHFIRGKCKYHMFPEPLSEERLSLLPRKDRPAISVIFTLDKKGSIIGEPETQRSLIKSKKKLSYIDAQKIIEGEACSFSQKLMSSVRTLHILAQHFRCQRLKNQRFHERYRDIRLYKDDPRVSCRHARELVEEFMILTNQFIASWLYNKDTGTLPLRCQDSPGTENLMVWETRHGFITDLLVGLQDRTLSSDITCDVTKRCQPSSQDRGQFVHVLNGVWTQLEHAASEKDSVNLRHLLCCDDFHPLQCLASDHWVRIQSPAVYRSSSQGQSKHYSLDIFPYTYFTSPLRRYIDVIVHRLVSAKLDAVDAPYTQKELEDITARLTVKTKGANKFTGGCTTLRVSEILQQTPMMFNAIIKDVDQMRVKLALPSLRCISEANKELRFNLLDCCTKPEMRQGENDEVEVLCFWNKRLYRYEDRHVRDACEDIRSVPQKGFAHLNSNMHVVSVPSHDFAKILKTFFEKTNISDVCNVNAQPLSVASNSIRKLSSERGGDNDINHHCKFSLKFKQGQVIKLQMHARAEGGMATPYVQLFQICDNLNLCLTHIQDPVKTFAKYVTQSVRDRTFGAIEEYQRAWLPIVAMETATSSVSSEATSVIENVEVQLKKIGSSIFGSFELDAKFCDCRQIEFGGRTVERLEKLGSKEGVFERCSHVGSLDYLCLRYTPPNNDFNSTFGFDFVWVGHAVIKKVKQRKTPRIGSREWHRSETKDPYGGNVVVTFKFKSNSLKPPPHLFIGSFVATVEVIVKSEIDRRTEQMLEILARDGTALAQSIALDTWTHDIPTAESCSFKQRLSIISPSEVEVEAVTIQKNNQSQTTAIETALVKPFTLIQGPPGTGKTSTGLKLVYLFNKINKEMFARGADKEQKQVLFCGPSNKSVDLVAAYLMNKLGDHCPNILRVYGKTIVIQDFPVPKRDIISRRTMRGLKSDPSIKRVTLHHVIRQTGKRFADKIREFDGQFKSYFDDPKNTEITLEMIKTYSRLVAKAEQDEIKKCDVILCTCVVAGGRKLTEVARISQCIIDESGMCTEPQSMIPIIGSRTDQVVLIGDHRQLRPIVKCKQAANLGLDQSLFERFRKNATFLNTQYRMHKRICEFPAREFYQGNLLTGPEMESKAAWYIPPGRELSIWPVRSNPKVFCHVEGVEQTLTVSTEEGNEQSKSNKLEVEKVADAFLHLIKKEGVHVKDINVMTQYNAQRHLIRNRLENIDPIVKQALTVQTVVASQGGEWDYVIFSTVRSLPRYKIEREATMGWLKHNLGFITDQNQINVALTRARKGLIIIGNSKLLNCDRTWRSLLNSYKSENCFVCADEFPKRRDR